MALSTRARIAGIGGALAIGVLGAGGAAYAAGGTDAPTYVQVVEESTAPGTGGWSAEDCPEGAGGGTQGDGTAEGGGTEGSGTTPGDA